MAEGSVSERRVRPIQDAAASGNWKQALQLCEKWAKKGEKSDRFLAVKATILLKQPDTNLHERGKQQIIQLCSREPAITEIVALQQIQDALRDLSLHKQEGTKLWERAIAKDPQNQDLLMTWLYSSVVESNWLSAQKAAVALRKAFPKERKYDFWKTLFSYLIQQDPTLEDNQRTLFGTLAYRFISKAAETVPEDKDQLLSPPEALQTPEELGLLVDIYLTTGRAAEAVKLLSSNSLGLSSRFAAEDPGLVLHLLIESFKRARTWQEVFDFCEPRLKSEETADPALWELILTALHESQNNEMLVERTQKMALDRIRIFPNDRNGYLYALSVAKPGGGADLKLSDVCQQYYEKFKAKAFCFEDLRRPVSLLDETEKTAFLEMTRKDHAAESPDERLAVIKMKYCFQPGLLESREELEQIAKAALDLYDSCRKISRACPEAGFLAAVALVKVAQLQDQSQGDGGSTYREVLLQAAMLLESCQKDQKHGEEYYPHLILLIRVQQMLGLMAMAMYNYKKLNVKNIQFESVGYFLLERISTLHPHQVGKVRPNEDNAYSPLEQLDLALEMLDRSENTLTQQINAGLGFGTYPSVIKAIQMRSNLQRSINREIFAYEHLKTRRLTGLLDEGGHPIPDYPLVDQRDFSFLQTYEISGRTPLHYLQLEPSPKKPIWDDDRAVGLLRSALEKFDEASDVEITNELTESEAENVAVHRTLARLIIQPEDFAASKQAQIDLSLDQLEAWLISKLEPLHGCVTIRGITLPSWEYLHASFTALETIQGISLFLSVTSKNTNKVSKALVISKETISKLQLLVTEAEAAIHKQAKDIKETLNEAGVLGKLVDVVTGRSENGNQQSDMGAALEKQGDASRHETFCGDMKESWENAVDGILACKIKILK